jgi:uncharacterized protein (TIGR03437 family)
MTTADGGTKWSTLGSRLPRVVVYSLVLHRASRTLRAATHGRSVWDIAVPLSSPSVQPTITSISPDVVNAGGPAFSLSVRGTNFTSGTTIGWNGQDRPTKLVDRSHLTVQISGSDIVNVGRASILAFSASTGAGASNPVALIIGPAPASASNAIVSAANPLGGSAVAPLSIASIYGAHLAGGTIGNFAPPLPVAAGGTALIFGAQQVPAPLFFVSPGQINFQVPRLPPGPNQLTIQQDAFSTTVTVTVTPFAPALFTTNSQGTGQAAALIAGTAALAAPAGKSHTSHPVKKGDFILLYCTGLGDVFNGPDPGDPAPSDPPAETVVKPTVAIGGVPAHVSFAGLAPGFAGLYQVNVQVPAAASSGSAVPVVLKIGGVASNTVTIAIE